ncbi:DUF5688 family protein [Butyrivibrio sp. NC2007]|uniref:DUF5688 family protein n=1 Tax=Butyrivibrio sp. NC2007 TaxID=1280683 RepID=UPI0003B58129|nr:DUF5688 family protein [Butyrivibrio sp. NC2007]
MDYNKTIEVFGADLSSEIKQRLEQKLGEEVSVEVVEKIKTNVKTHAVTARVDGESVAPSVDIDDLFIKYKHGYASLEEIAEQLSESLIHFRKPEFEMPVLTAEEAKKHVILNVVNADRNQELLSNVPHYKITDDLAVICRWMVSEEASFVVTKQICQELEMTGDEVLQAGQDNINKMPFKVEAIGNVLAGMLGENPVSDVDPGIYVLTNESTINGSNVLLSRDTLNRVHSELGDGSDIIIIPSSRHEVLALKITDQMDPDSLREIIKSVNEATVSDADYLSDSLYRYDGNKLTIVGDSFTPEVEQSVGDDSPSMSFGIGGL